MRFYFRVFLQKTLDFVLSLLSCTFVRTNIFKHDKIIFNYQGLIFISCFLLSFINVLFSYQLLLNWLTSCLCVFAILPLFSSAFPEDLAARNQKGLCTFRIVFIHLSGIKGKFYCITSPQLPFQIILKIGFKEIILRADFPLPPRRFLSQGHSTFCPLNKIPERKRLFYIFLLNCL